VDTFLILACLIQTYRIEDLCQHPYQFVSDIPNGFNWYTFPVSDIQAASKLTSKNL